MPNSIKKMRLILVVLMCLFVLAGCGSADAKSGAADVQEKAEQSTEDQTTAVVTTVDQTSKDDKGSKPAANTSTSEKKSSSATKSSVKTSKASSNKGKTWVPAEYKTVEHPAETRVRKYVDYYTCQCGQIFASEDSWQAHRPKPCDGKHTYAQPHIVQETIVVNEAYTEKVLVSEGHWE